VFQAAQKPEVANIPSILLSILDGFCCKTAVHSGRLRERNNRTPIAPDPHKAGGLLEENVTLLPGLRKD
jgi:hypothetical protein